MKFYARSNYFYRILIEYFQDVPWISMEAACEHFVTCAAEYLEGKNDRGLEVEKVGDDGEKTVDYTHLTQPTKE